MAKISFCLRCDWMLFEGLLSLWENRLLFSTKICEELRYLTSSLFFKIRIKKGDDFPKTSCKNARFSNVFSFYFSNLIKNSFIEKVNEFFMNRCILLEMLFLGDRCLLPVLEWKCRRFHGSIVKFFSQFFGQQGIYLSQYNVWVRVWIKTENFWFSSKYKL